MMPENPLPNQSHRYYSTETVWKWTDGRKGMAENTLSKQQFYLTWATEIRTPLNSIVDLQVLLKTELGMNKKMYNDKTSGKSLNLLINDILDLAK
jgi:signal transduction histidine kinase